MEFVGGCMPKETRIEGISSLEVREILKEFSTSDEYKSVRVKLIDSYGLNRDCYNVYIKEE